VRRTRALADGATRTEVAALVAASFGIVHRLLPMSDDPVRTTVHTPDGALAFQHYFVRERCDPAVTGFEFRGAAAARPSPALLDWLGAADGLVICPSTPFVSVDPMLSVPGMRQALIDAPAPVVAVSPIVGGTALKGPAAKMMRELQLPASADQVAAHYAGLLDGFVMDQQDAALTGLVSVPTVVTQTVMRSLQDRIDLAGTVLGFLRRLARP